MDDDMFDIPQETTGAALAPLREACEEGARLTAEIKNFEYMVKTMRSRLYQLRTKMIPDMMAEAGIGDTFSLAPNENFPGWEIKLGMIVEGGLPKTEDSVFEEDDPREIALKEVIRLGGTNLIKNQIAATFVKGEHELAMKSKEALADLGVPVEIVESIHASSYKKFIREAFEDGKDIDADKLGVYIGPAARFKEVL